MPKVKGQKDTPSQAESAPKAEGLPKGELPEGNPRDFLPEEYLPTPKKEKPEPPKAAKPEGSKASGGVRLEVFLRLAGRKLDQLAGFESHARLRKLKPMPMASWTKELSDFDRKPTK